MKENNIFPDNGRAASEESGRLPIPIYHIFGNSRFLYRINKVVLYP